MTVKIHNHDLATIEIPTTSNLILKEMFDRPLADDLTYQTIHVLAQFRDGRSGAYVYEVMPELSDGSRQLRVVVKIGPTLTIEAEWDAYQRLIRNCLPNAAEIDGKPVSLAQYDVSGIRYRLAGGGISDLISLRDFVKQSQSSAAVDLAMGRLFKSMDYLWRRESDHAQPQRFNEIYEQKLPANLVIMPCLDQMACGLASDCGAFSSCMAPHPSDGAILLSPETIDIREWMVGDTVLIYGFDVMKYDADKRHAVLNLPPFHRSFRIELNGFVDEQFHAVGQRLSRPIRGRIVHRRQDFYLAQAADLLGSLAAARHDYFERSNGARVPNPIHHIGELLNRPRRMRLSAQHGDLHLFNVVVEQDGSLPTIIDFSDAQVGHALHDLMQLEVSVWLDFLAEETTELSLDFIYDFYRRLSSGRDGYVRLRGLNQQQQRGLKLVWHIRRQLSGYLHTAGEWNEYTDGLCLTFLKFLKFGERSASERRVALWAAGVQLDVTGVSVGEWPVADGSHLVKKPSGLPPASIAGDEWVAELLEVMRPAHWGGKSDQRNAIARLAGEVAVR